MALRYHRARPTDDYEHDAPPSNGMSIDWLTCSAVTLALVIGGTGLGFGAASYAMIKHHETVEVALPVVRPLPTTIGVVVPAPPSCPVGIGSVWYSWRDDRKESVTAGPDMSLADPLHDFAGHANVITPVRASVNPTVAFARPLTGNMHWEASFWIRKQGAVHVRDGSWSFTLRVTDGTTNEIGSLTVHPTTKKDTPYTAGPTAWYRGIAPVFRFEVAHADGLLRCVKTVTIAIDNLGDGMPRTVNFLHD
jgi:hypothetical protein